MAPHVLQELWKAERDRAQCRARQPDPDRGRYVDALTYQYYAFWPDQEVVLDRCARLTGKAFLSGDSSCSVPNPNMPNPFGPHCADQFERVERFDEIVFTICVI